MEKALQLSPPWITIYREIQAMFKHDKTVKVIYNNDTPSVNVYVEDPVKADAIEQILIHEFPFGNVKLRVNVYPGDDEELLQDLSVGADKLFTTAFKDNSALSFTTEDQKGLFAETYIVFVPEVVQFFNDDLSDIRGLESTL
jgi:hypothetical protein